MSEDRWGPGDKDSWRYLSDEKNECQDGTPFRLFFGEHPHSRSDNTIYADFGEGGIIEFDGHRVRSKVVIEEANYVKCSGLSGNEVRKQAWADIHLDGKLCYRLTGGRTVTALMQRVPQVLVELQEHPVQLWRADWDGLIGRKVFYRDQPGVVRGYWPEQGCVWIEADGCQFKPAVWQEVEDGPETHAKDDFLSPHIWWFRETVEIQRELNDGVNR